MRNQCTAILIVTLAFCVMKGDSLHMNMKFWKSSGCKKNSDCAVNLVCEKKKCEDPCKGLCGMNAVCTVMNHSPSCSCMPSYKGDPYTGCYQETASAQTTSKQEKPPQGGSEPQPEEEQQSEEEQPPQGGSEQQPEEEQQSEEEQPPQGDASTDER